jgi:hypothetical protein
MASFQPPHFLNQVISEMVPCSTTLGKCAHWVRKQGSAIKIQGHPLANCRLVKDVALSYRGNKAA